MSDPSFDAHLDAVLIGGREKRPVVILPYDPSWRRRFRVERLRIVGVLGAAARAVHHVGSTSVEGLAAKPIVDIVVEVPEPEREETYVPPLERAGYVLRVRESGHRMLRTRAHDVHVHVWSAPADLLRHVVFRDWLRYSTEDRAAYEALKHELARREWEDMNYYAAAKSALIAEIMVRAEAWAASSNRTVG